MLKSLIQQPIRNHWKYLRWCELHPGNPLRRQGHGVTDGSDFAFCREETEWNEIKESYCKGPAGGLSLNLYSENSKKEEREHYWKRRTDRWDLSLCWRERKRESWKTLRLMEGERGNGGTFSTQGEPRRKHSFQQEADGPLSDVWCWQVHFQGMGETRKCNCQTHLVGLRDGKACSVLCAAESTRRDKSVSYNSDGVGRAGEPGRWHWNDPQSLYVHMATQRRKRGAETGWVGNPAWGTLEEEKPSTRRHPFLTTAPGSGVSPHVFPVAAAGLRREEGSRNAEYTHTFRCVFLSGNGHWRPRQKPHWATVSFWILLMQPTLGFGHAPSVWSETCDPASQRTVCVSSNLFRNTSVTLLKVHLQTLDRDLHCLTLERKSG